MYISNRQHLRQRAAYVAVVSTLFLTACGGSEHLGESTYVAPTRPTVTVLSTKADYVSGGSVLVDVAVPAAASQSSPPTLSVGGLTVSPSLVPDASNPGHFVGFVTGLKAGANSIFANTTDAVGVTVVTNYGNGPILSGPRTTPFNCQTQDFVLPDGTKLGAATDADCSAPTKVQYMYLPAGATALKPMATTTALPADVATTTTTTGAKVPFVVRIETGTMNRGIYQNAILFNPLTDKAPTALTPPAGWNKRLIAVHGTGCATGWYIQGAAMGVSPYTATNMTRLGEGYAVFTNTLNHPTNSCNALLAGETTMMGKQHFIEEFGVPAFTVSVGTSGGAYTSLQIADAFPGLFDGVFIDATFPDALSIAMSASDDKLLNHYLTVNNGSALTEQQMVKVSGHKSPRAWYDLAVQSGRTDPVSGRVETIPTAGSLGGAYQGGAFNAAVPVAQRWNAVTNPTGARATVFDVSRNVYGVDAQGYALRPFDNVGVQYGLAQVNDGTITVDQFLDMNEKIGGYDRDGNYTAGRTTGSVDAIKRVHQAGLQLNGGAGLASIPVFDLSNYYDEDNFYHYQFFHFAARERMLKANGDTKNHVMWRGGVSFNDLFGIPTAGRAERTAVNAKAQADAWPLFIRWVAAYKAASGAASQRDKVIANKPAEAVDGCFSLSTAPTFIAETQTPAASGAAGTCNAIWPTWTFPRAQAGESIAADVLKCQLKPVATSDYKQTFTSAQLNRLQSIFPSGTCDYSKPGVNQVNVVPYPSVGPSPVNQIFDITKP